jgi:hypothetical protein
MFARQAATDMAKRKSVVPDVFHDIVRRKIAKQSKKHPFISVSFGCQFTGSSRAVCKRVGQPKLAKSRDTLRDP